MILIHNVDVYPISASPIRNGAVAWKDGKIVAIGTVGAEGPEAIAPEVKEAAGQLKLIDGQGGVLMPGMIDAHCHAGVHEEGIGWEGADYNEATGPVTPDMRTIDGINPEERGLKDALQGGVTAVCVVPGSANVIGGSATVIHTWGSSIVDQMVIANKVGMKCAFGENPKRVYRNKDKSPATRMATAAVMREWLTKARDYEAKKARAAEKGEHCDTDLKLEALLPVVKGEIPLRAHAHRADDIVTAVRIAEEYGVRIVIEHCTEGHKIADFLAAKGIPAIVGPTLSSRSKIEVKDKSFATPGILAKAGVTVALTMDHPVIPIENLPVVGAMVMKTGMTEEEALAAITLNPARILGLDSRLGSIEAGKDADVVLWSGHPFDVQSSVKKVWIGGEEAI